MRTQEDFVLLNARKATFNFFLDNCNVPFQNPIAFMCVSIKKSETHETLRSYGGEGA